MRWTVEAGLGTARRRPVLVAVERVTQVDGGPTTPCAHDVVGPSTRELQAVHRLLDPDRAIIIHALSDNPVSRRPSWRWDLFHEHEIPWVFRLLPFV